MAKVAFGGLVIDLHNSFHVSGDVLALCYEASIMMGWAAGLDHHQVSPYEGAVVGRAQASCDTHRTDRMTAVLQLFAATVPPWIGSRGSDARESIR